MAEDRASVEEDDEALGRVESLGHGQVPALDSGKVMRLPPPFLDMRSGEPLGELRKITDREWPEEDAHALQFA